MKFHQNGRRTGYPPCISALGFTILCYFTQSIFRRFRINLHCIKKLTRYICYTFHQPYFFGGFCYRFIRSTKREDLLDGYTPIYSSVIMILTDYQQRFFEHFRAESKFPEGNVQVNKIIKM